MDFPSGSDGKGSTCSAGELGSIPGLGRSPGEEKGYPLQYSFLENFMHRGVQWATVHGVTKNWKWLSKQHFLYPYNHICYYIRSQGEGSKHSHLNQVSFNLYYFFCKRYSHSNYQKYLQFSCHHKLHTQTHTHTNLYLYVCNKIELTPADSPNKILKLKCISNVFLKIKNQ